MKKTIASLMLITMMATLTNGIEVKGHDNEIEIHNDETSTISETSVLTTDTTTIVDEKDLVEEDKDNDGLVNWLEEYLGTSDNNVDSDGDGVSDYEELYVLHTDPTLKDSNNNGINDGEEDQDKDGIINLDEYLYGTSLVKADTDSDGLSDYDEIFIYKTNPTLADSDGDGALDGWEVENGYSPLEYNYEFNVNKEIISMDELIKFKAELNSASGNQVNTLEITELYDDFDLNESIPGYIGSGYEIKVEEEIKDLTVLFEINNNMTNNKDFKPAIYYYDEDLKILNEVENQVIDGNVIKGDSSIFNKYILLNKSEFNRVIEEAKENLKAIDKLELQNMKDAKNLDKIDSKILKNIDTEKDSNKDGISDYDTKAIVEGSLLTGLGTNVFEGFTYEEIQANDDLDGDGIKNGEELIISEISGMSYVQVLSSTAATDSDFDGRNDTIDSSPTNNVYNATLTTDYASSQVSYKMDYRWFFQSNTTYKQDLSVVSSLLSSAIYSGSKMNIYDNSKKDNCNSSSIATIMNFHGLTNVEVYKLSTNYSDNDLSEVAIGYRPVTYNGVTKNVVAVIVRGTNGTIQEWSSNFDIGDTTTFSKYADWTKSTNHKGFDVPANRIITKLNSYLTAKGISSSTNTFWVTGHSRGAAIANIIGAKLTDQGKTNYTYTFAAPNTTTASTAANYTSIFNILNEDDFVPYLPMSKWGYKRYGKVATVSIAKNYETQWESLLGKFDYNPDTLGMQDTITKLGAIATNGNSCYKYTCTHHGDGSLNNITMRNYGMSQNSREEAIAKIPTNALPYGKITRYIGSGIAGWDFEVCQTPEYFMQVLAAKMAGTISNYRFVVELNVASRYESAKSAIIASAIGGLEHPHYTETYYLLATKLTASSF